MSPQTKPGPEGETRRIGDSFPGHLLSRGTDLQLCLMSTWMLLLVHTAAPTLTFEHPQSWWPTSHDFWRASQAGSKNYAPVACLWCSPHRASLKSSLSALSMPQSCRERRGWCRPDLLSCLINSKPLEIPCCGQSLGAVRVYLTLRKHALFQESANQSCQPRWRKLKVRDTALSLLSDRPVRS